jgi:hypothetical protein
MFEMVKLAGVSAVLAASLVIATGDREVARQAPLRPSLVVAFDESQPDVNAVAAPSRPDTISDIVLK